MIFAKGQALLDDAATGAAKMNELTRMTAALTAFIRSACGPREMSAMVKTAPSTTA